MFVSPTGGQAAGLFIPQVILWIGQTNVTNIVAQFGRAFQFDKSNVVLEFAKFTSWIASDGPDWDVFFAVFFILFKHVVFTNSDLPIAGIVGEFGFPKLFKTMGCRQNVVFSDENASAQVFVGAIEAKSHRDKERPLASQSLDTTDDTLGPGWLFNLTTSQHQQLVKGGNGWVDAFPFRIGVCFLNQRVIKVIPSVRQWKVAFVDSQQVTLSSLKLFVF